MSLDSLEDAFYDELCDVYHAEKQLVKALPKMVKKASNKTLAAAFEAQTADGDRLTARGIEVGHIFYFGTKYSEPMGATVVGPDGSRVPVPIRPAAMASEILSHS